MTKQDVGSVADWCIEQEAKMTNKQRATLEIYHTQINRVMDHMRHTAELCGDERHGESWWAGGWPAYPRAAAIEVTLNDNDHHDWDFGKLLDEYKADLNDHEMHERLASLEELLGEVGCDVFD